MKNKSTASQIQKINALVTKTSAACGGDAELQSYWAEYLCVVCAGLLENAVEQIFGGYVTRSASPAVASYAVASLAKIQNPKSSRFVEIARTFKPEWGDKLQAFVGDAGREEAINSIMTNRHAIAHGKSSNVTVAQIKNWLAKSVEVLEYLEDLCV